MPPKGLRRSDPPPAVETGLTPTGELSATSTPTAGTPTSRGTSCSLFGRVPSRRSTRAAVSATYEADAEVSASSASAPVSSFPCDDNAESAPQPLRARGRRIKDATPDPPSPQPEENDASGASELADSTPQPPRGRGRPPRDAKPAPSSPQREENDAYDVSDFAEAAAAVGEGESLAETSGPKTVPEYLTADNVEGLEIISLIDFWGRDGSKMPKKHEGTLADPTEPDLKLGERVLLIAPEEGEFGKHQLCYRHLMVVKQLGAEGDPAFQDQVKLKFELFPNPKHDVWYPKRSWEIERVNKDRLREYKVFNRLYAKVKAYMSAQNKRTKKDVELTRPSKKQQLTEASVDKEDADVEGQASGPSKQTSAKIKTTAPRKKRFSDPAAVENVTASKKSERGASLPSDDSDDAPILPNTKKQLNDRAAAVVVHTESKSVKHAVDAAPAAKKPKKKVYDSSSSSSASVSSSSASSASDDSAYESDIGAKRKQSKKGHSTSSRAADKHREPKARPPSLHSESLSKPVLKLKKEENKEKSTDQSTPSAVSANDAKVSGKSSSQSSHVQQSPRPVPDPASKVLAPPMASLSDSARPTAVNPKFTGSEKIVKPPAAVVVASGGQLPSSIAAKASNPIKELDLQQRWREKQAAAPQIKRELPPLPSFHATSLPPLPELPPLPSLASAKSKPAVIADVKPAPVKVAPPSPVHPYVCGPPFRELSECEEADADIVMGESLESLLKQFVGPLDHRRSNTGEKLLLSNADWRKLSNCLPEWPPRSYAQWKADNSSTRSFPRRDATDIAQLRVELVAISSSSDKPIALGADSKEKAKELLDWSSQLDRIDELVHTREELRAYSPPRSRFNQTDFNSRSYIFTASRVSRVPLWARSSDEDRLQEDDVVDSHFIALAMQLLQPWYPAFGIKHSHNQFFVMFEDHAPPSRLRSWIKRDILSRRSQPYFESCSNIVATRAGEHSANEHDWFGAAAEATNKDMPHCVRTVFHNGAAYDLRMQRVMWPVGPNDEYWIAEEAYHCAAHAKSKCSNNVVDNESAVLFCGDNDQVVLLSAFAYESLSFPLSDLMPLSPSSSLSVTLYTPSSPLHSSTDGLLNLCEAIAIETGAHKDSSSCSKQVAAVRDADATSALRGAPDGRPEMEDLRPQVEAFQVPGHTSSGLTQQQQHPNILHRNQNHNQPPPLHQPQPHQPFTQPSAAPLRKLWVGTDLFIVWRHSPEVPPPKDEHVHKLFADLGYERCKKINWIPATFKNSTTCFAAVQDLHQLDNMIRLIKSKAPIAMDVYKVDKADASRSTWDNIAPAEVVVKFWPVSKEQPRSSTVDVMKIAAAARLPEPLNVGFSSRQDCDECFLRYILPGQAEAFVAHCTQHSRYLRGDFAWKLECCLQASSVSSAKRD